MSSKSVKFKLNSAGVQELLKSGAMKSVLSQNAAKKANAAGEGYASSVHIGQKRAYANVYPETKEAAFDNLENNTLEKVIRS